MSKYYSTSKIDKKNATYNVIFGERSNGKTFALLSKSLKQYFNDGSQMAYVRRWKEDITGRRASQLYGGINDNGIVEKLSGGEFKGVHYYAGKWYLCNYDDNGKVIYGDNDIIAYAFSLTDNEHNKSTSFPKIKTVVFDEFLTGKVYLPDEFVSFMNTISTIVRKRTDVKIYMLGNTVNKFCPYFGEMGLNNVQAMKQGTIDVYHYGESPLTVAVEYCKSNNTGKDSEENKYFAFDNPKLEMITGGTWEMSLFPHLPYKYKPNQVLLEFFIDFNDNIYHGEVITVDETTFIYIHDKTTPIRKPHEQIIYSLDYHAEINYNRSIFRPMSRTQEKILYFFKHDKVFYQNNSIGDAVSNYLKIAKRV